MVLHALTAVLLVLALRMFVPTRLAVFGALLYALWPTTFYYAGKGSSETMLTLWMTVAFVLLLRLMRSPAATTAAGLGVAIGLACLTRGSGVVMLAITLAWLGAAILRRRALGRVALVVLVAWTLTMAPWWVRNARITGAFVPFHSLVWYNAFHDDRFDGARGWLAQTGRAGVDWGDLPDDAYPESVVRHPVGFRYPAGLDARGDLEQEARYREIMLEKFRSPGYLARKAARNAVDFWAASASVSKSRVLGVSSILWLLLLAWGTWRAWRERAWRGALFVCHAATWLTFVLYLPFFAIFRHSIPIAPFIAFSIALGVAGTARMRARP
jgi:4-amino-4-deoxy-L-arabinose transferase-like glycosyltransferase